MLCQGKTKHRKQKKIIINLFKSSFVDDFINDSNMGIHLLLNLLRQTLNRQKYSTSTRYLSDGEGKKLLRPSEKQHMLKRSMVS